MNLQPGDIGATKGKGFLGWINRKLFSPTTDRFHFLIIWKPWGQGDFLILESISKGLAVGLLSWYKGKDIEFYRVNCDEDLRFAAPDGLVEWGRARYDYLLFIKLIAGVVVACVKILWKEHKLRKLRAEDLPYGVNSSLICTEACDVAFDSCGVAVIPLGVIPIPSAFKTAELEGRMTRIEE